MYTIPYDMRIQEWKKGEGVSIRQLDCGFINPGNATAIYGWYLHIYSFYTIAFQTHGTTPVNEICLYFMMQ